MSFADRPKPMRVPEAEFYWDGCRAGELRLQRCTSCETVYFPARPQCPACGSREVVIIKASGRATLHSYIINHLPAPGYEPPFAVGVVALEEGPRMMTNIVNCPQTPEAITVDMPLEVVFEDRGDLVVPQFQPATGDTV